MDDQNKLVLSVAVPIQRFRAIYGVLFLSTEGGDIDDILRQERFTLIEVFLVAFGGDAGVVRSIWRAPSPNRCGGWPRRPTRCASAAAGATPFPAFPNATTRSAIWPTA